MGIDLCIQLGLNSIKQRAVHYGLLFAVEDVAFEGHFANIEAIAKQMGERPTGERNAADFLSRLRLNTHAGKHHGSTAAFIDDGKNLLGLVWPDVD